MDECFVAALLGNLSDDFPTRRSQVLFPQQRPFVRPGHTGPYDVSGWYTARERAPYVPRCAARGATMPRLSWSAARCR